MIWFIIKRFLDKSTENYAKHSSSATLFLHIHQSKAFFVYKNVFKF